jgi:hypothetical protein
MTDFAAPAAGGDNWAAADSVDHLCVFEVHGQEQDVETDYGPKDPIRATVHDVDAQATYEDTLIFQGYMVGSLKRRIGQKVLARIVLGEAKKGQKPPYLLEDASGDPAAAQRATDYLQAYAAGQFASPAEAAQAQAPVPAASAGSAPQVDLADPAVQAALAALQAQGVGVK